MNYAWAARPWQAKRGNAWLRLDQGLRQPKAAQAILRRGTSLLGGEWVALPQSFRNR